MEHEGGTHHEAHHKQKQVTLRLKKSTLIAIAAVVLVGAFGYFCRGLFVAAIVDGMPISRLSVVRELESVSGKAALDSLVLQRLIRAEALKKGVTASEAEIDEEIAKIGIQMSMQGSSLEAALQAQGMSLATLRKQIHLQKLVDKLVAGTVSVTDEEITQYIKTNSAGLPPGEESSRREFAKGQLEQQKLGAAKAEFVNDLRTNAKVITVVSY